MHFQPETLRDPAGWIRGELALSMEVIFHLTEESTFCDHMDRLFGSASRFVVICSNDSPGTEIVPSERHWNFTRWIEENRPQWRLLERVDPPSGLGLMSSLYLYGLDSKSSAGRPGGFS
jgi:hypothetical protein